jgi:hypothetical protein
MRRALLLALALALAGAPASLAGTGGQWTPVSRPYSENFNLAGLERTGDGVLHVVSLAKDADPSTEGVIHAGVASNGTVGGFTPVTTGWVGLSSPDLSFHPGGGLAAMWGGLHSTTTGDPQNDSGIATSDDSGSAWSVSAVSPITGGYVYASQISIANGFPTGPLFQSWFSTTGTYVHRGTDKSTPDSDYQAQIGGYGSVPGFALGGERSLWLGWQASFAHDNNGVWAQQVDQATGAPSGSPMKMPGSSVDYQGAQESSTILGRTPITARPGRPGVYMAYSTGYPTATKLLLWKVGDAGTVQLADSKGANIRQLAITSDPDGRLIVVWGEDTGGAGKLFARVSSTDATSWAPAFEIPTLPKAAEGWAVQASAQSGALLDVVENYTESDGSTMRFWHTQAVAPPVLAKAVNASVVSGKVLVQLPGTNTFVQLSHDSQIPVGTIVDTTQGRVRIVEALPGGKTASSDFFQGIFKVAQAKNGLADLTLAGGNFKVCGRGASASAAKSTVIRHLWGAGKGKFRTKGKYASAAIRGTTWDTIDRCDGTLVKVTKGSVTVRDFKARKNVVVSAGHSYLAKR